MDNEIKEKAPLAEALAAFKEALSSAVKAGVPEKDISDSVVAVFHAGEEDEEKNAAKDFGLPGFVD